MKPLCLLVNHLTRPIFRDLRTGSFNSKLRKKVSNLFSWVLIVFDGDGDFVRYSHFFRISSWTFLPLDIRPLVQEVGFENGTLTILIRFVDNRTATPRDVLRALSLPWEELRHKTRRRNIGWQ